MQMLKSVSWKTTNSNTKLITLELPDGTPTKPPLLKVDAFAVTLEDIEDFIHALAEARLYMQPFVPAAAAGGRAP